MPSYFKDLIEIDKTIEEWQFEYKKAKGYDKWMCGRRESDYVHSRNLQLNNIHVIRLTISNASGEYSVCSCGLKTNSKKDFEKATGHLYRGEVVHQIIVWRSQEVGKLLFCQLCEGTFHPVFASKKEIGGVPDIDVQATLEKHSNCNGTSEEN